MIIVGISKKKRRRAMKACVWSACSRRSAIIKREGGGGVSFRHTFTSSSFNSQLSLAGRFVQKKKKKNTKTETKKRTDGTPNRDVWQNCVSCSHRKFFDFFIPVAPAVVELPLDWKLLFDSFPLLQADNRLVEAPSPSFPLRGLGNTVVRLCCF